MYLLRGEGVTFLPQCDRDRDADLSAKKPSDFNGLPVHKNVIENPVDRSKPGGLWFEPVADHVRSTRSVDQKDTFAVDPLWVVERRGFLIGSSRPAVEALWTSS